MANQDSGLIEILGALSSSITGQTIIDSGFVSFAGSLLSNVSGGTIAESGFISLSGALDATLTGQVKGGNFISFRGTGSVSINTDLFVPTGKITFSGALSAAIATQTLVNGYAAMYGFLSAKANGRRFIYCAEVTLDMEMQIIDSTVCAIKGEGMELIRYRGDNYPVQAVLGIAGITDTTGFTFKMSTQIEGGAVHTAVGVITDSVNGRVSFTLPAEAVATAGAGFYDIEGNDGIYTYTYQKGIFTLLNDLTPEV